MNRDDFIQRKSDCIHPRQQPMCRGLGRNNLGVTAELERYHTERLLDQRRREFSLRNLNRARPASSQETDSSKTSCSMPVDDLLETNAVIDTNQPEKPLAERYFKFVSSYINLNSRCRVIDETEPFREVREVKNVNQADTSTARTNLGPSTTRGITVDDALTDAAFNNATTVGEGDVIPMVPSLGEALEIAQEVRLQAQTGTRAPPPPRPTCNEKVLTTDDNVVSAATTGGEDVAIAREGDFPRRGGILDQRRQTRSLIEIDNPVQCEAACPDHVGQACACNITDTTRLQGREKPPTRNCSKPTDRVIANMIVENTANANNDIQTDTAFMGREELHSQVNLESGGDGIRLVPPTACDPALVTLSRIDGSNPQRQTLNNTRSVGGLLPPIVGERTIMCVGNTETNRFLFQLDRRYSNVKLVKLVSSTFPIYDTIINQFNNKILFQLQRENNLLTTPEGDNVWEYLIPEGNYTASELAIIIREDINALIRDGIFDDGSPFDRDDSEVFIIDIDSLRRRFTIRVADPYTFTWEFVTVVDNCRSLYRMLGFREPKLVNFSDNFSNSGQFRFTTDDYILIGVRSFKDTQMPLFDCVTNQYFFNKVVLKAESSNGNLVVFDQHLDMEIIFDQSDGNFEFLDFVFFNQDGQPIDFEGCDFSLGLVIVEYVDRLVGQGLSTRRGVIDYTSITRNVVQKLQ